MYLKFLFLIVEIKSPPAVDPHLASNVILGNHHPVSPGLKTVNPCWL